MRPELEKMWERALICPWVSPLILLCHTGGKFFSRTEKLEDKPEIKRGLPPSRMWWKNQRLDRTDRRLRKRRPTKWSRASDRPNRWANDQEHVVSNEKTGKVKKQPRNVSWLNLTTHWGKFFESGFEKFWRKSGSTLERLSRSRAKGTEAEIWILHRRVWFHTGANFSVNWKIVKKS